MRGLSRPAAHEEGTSDLSYSYLPEMMLFCHVEIIFSAVL